jgi:hypothetical protein
VEGALRLRRTLTVTRALAADPREGVERVVERVADRIDRHPLWQPWAPDWLPRLHRFAGAAYPCEAESEFPRVWNATMTTLAQLSLGVGRGAFGGWDDGNLALGLAVWCAAVHLRPRRVVETGVGRGVTTRIVLEALRRAGWGRLWSVDVPPLAEPSLGAEVGAAVPDELRSRWTLVVGSSRRRLPGLLGELGEIDLFVHDSMHTTRNVRFELEQSWPALRPGGIVLVDDVEMNVGFHHFCDRTPDAEWLVAPHDDGRGLFGIAQKRRIS